MEIKNINLFCRSLLYLYLIFKLLSALLFEKKICKKTDFQNSGTLFNAFIFPYYIKKLLYSINPFFPNNSDETKDYTPY